MVHQYVHGTSTPRTELLARAVAKWDLQIVGDGFVFDRNAFQLSPTTKERAQPVQLDLKALIEGNPAEIVLPGNGVSLVVSASSDGMLQIGVRIRIAA